MLGLEDAKVLVMDESAASASGTDQELHSATATDSLFLTRAIAPPNRPGADKISQFTVKTIAPTHSSVYENLDDYAATVILVATRTLTPNIGTRLERYVSNGGSAWFFLGPQTNSYDYNKLLCTKEGQGLLTCRLAHPERGYQGRKRTRLHTWIWAVPAAASAALAGDSRMAAT